MNQQNRELCPGKCVIIEGKNNTHHLQSNVKCENAKFSKMPHQNEFACTRSVYNRVINLSSLHAVHTSYA